MAELYSQYFSGIQLTAGTIAGSVLGTSGINPIVDRLNSITSANSLVIGSLISGTKSVLYISGGKFLGSATGATDIANKNYVDSILGGMDYYTVPGVNFVGREENQAYTINDDGLITAGQNGSFYVGVILPGSSIINELVVYGSNSSNTWELMSTTISGTQSSTVMAGANHNSIDSSIVGSVIDNEANMYYIRTYMNTSNSIKGLRILYTKK